MPETPGQNIKTVRKMLRERDERAAEEPGDARADHGPPAGEQPPADDEPGAPE